MEEVRGAARRGYRIHAHHQLGSSQLAALWAPDTEQLQCPPALNQLWTAALTSCFEAQEVFTMDSMPDSADCHSLHLLHAVLPTHTAISPASLL